MAMTFLRLPAFLVQVAFLLNRLPVPFLVNLPVLPVVGLRSLLVPFLVSHLSPARVRFPASLLVLSVAYPVSRVCLARVVRLSVAYPVSRA